MTTMATTPVTNPVRKEEAAVVEVAEAEEAAAMKQGRGCSAVVQ